MLRKPVLRVQDINPMLFTFVEELNDVKVGELSCFLSLPMIQTSCESDSEVMESMKHSNL